MNSVRTLALVAIITSCATLEDHEIPNLRNQSLPALRFDGLYQTAQEGEDWSYLRFYPDGTVISVCSNGTPNDLKSWFTKEHANISIGTVLLEGAHLSFTSTSSQGAVDYEGELILDQLHLTLYSHINSYRGKDVYSFTQYDAEPDDAADRASPDR